jgi:hypothetical protein
MPIGTQDIGVCIDPAARPTLIPGGPLVPSQCVYVLDPNRPRCTPAIPGGFTVGGDLPVYLYCGQAYQDFCGN